MCVYFLIGSLGLNYNVITFQMGRIYSLSTDTMEAKRI